MRKTTNVVAVACVLASAGCAGNGEGLDANGRPLGSGDPGGPLVATFESIQANVFTPICSGCHAGATAPQGLRLDPASSYDLLVGVPSTEVSSLQRVEPGSPDDSYLVQKLEGSASVGGRMPLGGPYLDAATIDVIRQWITDGATREAAAMAARKPFELVTSAPANGDALGRPPAQLVLAFSRDLDASRIDASQVRLGRLVGGEVVPSNIDFDVATVMSNPRALVVTPRSALTSGRYVLQVEAAALADMQGTPFGPERPGGTSSGVRVVFDVGGTR